MTPADAHFQDWWRLWLRQQAGLATVPDLVFSRMAWEMSMAAQKKLGKVP